MLHIKILNKFLRKSVSYMIQCVQKVILFKSSYAKHRKSSLHYAKTNFLFSYFGFIFSQYFYFLPSS